MPNQIMIITPARVSVWLLPQPGSTKVDCVYNTEDPLSVNLAAQYVLREGWVEYAAGTVELDKDVVELIMSI